VRLDDRTIVLRSDLLAVRLEGTGATSFCEGVLPLLDGRRSLDEIHALLPNLDPEELRQQLDDLVAAGVLRRHDGSTPPLVESGTMDPFLAFLEAVGLPLAEARQRLASLRVAVIGLEGHGAQSAATLAACGVGELVLVDPYPCQPGNLTTLPLVGLDAVGQPREHVVRLALERQSADTVVTVGGTEHLDPNDLHALAPGCHLLLGCFDKAFSAVHGWLDAAALAHGVPTLHSRLEGHTAVIGPLVLPGRTACFACWRARRQACEHDPAEAAVYEALLDRQRRPALHERPVLPPLPVVVGGMVALEALKHLLELDVPTLAGKVQELDALWSRIDVHAVLRMPDCAVCGRDTASEPASPPLDELGGPSRSRGGDILGVRPALVSRRCGVVTALELAPKDRDEPVIPYVVMARLARYPGLDQPENRLCSGRGTTLAEAQRTALGEAVERYSSACSWRIAVRQARREQLEGASLDPRELVLYRPEQYETLPYAPYDDSIVMGWVETRSLISGSCVYVPALAVTVRRTPVPRQERICPVTSNGLASRPGLTDAVLAAALEVLERDAFLMAWLHRLPGQRVDPWSHPDPKILDLCDAYRRRGVEVRLHRLATDHPGHVFLALAVQRHGEGPAVVAGLGAGLEPATAARKAILEMSQVRPALQIGMRAPLARDRIKQLVADPRLVVTPEDHALLYTHPRAVGAFKFLEGDSPPVEVDWTVTSPPDATAAGLRRLVEHFRVQGGDLLYSDLTPPDMAELGLHTARVVIPGFQPLHFGWNERRLGGRRLYEFPHRLSLTRAPATAEQLNADPHPLA
jgi:ribosomal protein S12 methylthiotransferase accessory factor